MVDIRKTEFFEKWFKKLKDRRAKARIQARIDRKAKDLAKQLEE